MQNPPIIFCLLEKQKPFDLTYDIILAVLFTNSYGIAILGMCTMSIGNTIKMNAVTVDTLSHDGRGVAHVEGKTVFLEGGLPEEEVTYVLYKQRKAWDEGKVLSVVHPSQDRVIPRCDYFGVCGGCSLQHLNQAAQLKHKEQVLLEQLLHFGQVVPEGVLEPLKSDSWGYRHKARLSVRFVKKKNKILVGFKEKRSHFVLEMDSCEILHPKIGNILPDLKVVLSTLQAFQAIPQIEVAVGDAEAALVFRHLTPLTDVDKALLIDFGIQHQVHIYLQPEGVNSIEAIYPQGVNRLNYTLPDFGLTFLFHPVDFTQVNIEMNRQMVNRAMELLALKANDRVLDLFCGIGNFTLPMATLAKEVVGIEGNERMCERARENANHNQLKNVSFCVADLYTLDNNINQTEKATSEWLSKPYDAVLLDPPRTGASKEVLDLIAKTNASKIVYVSCNPATLARDVGVLVKQYGFRLAKAGIMDMFPHTTHVESIVLLLK